MNQFEKAVMFAVEAHEGTYRRGENTPYIIHPMEVAAIAGSITTDLDVLCAAVLHDTVEDTAVTIEDIEAHFGSRVKELVAGETEDKHDELPAADSWQMRKEESLAELAKCDDIGVKIIWLSDKLSNVRCYSRLYKKEGIEFWQNFNQTDRQKQYWYYQRIRELLSDLKDTTAWQEFNQLINIIFEEEQ